MTITVNGPGGITINFPDGTDHATIDGAMRQALGQSGDQSMQDRFATAFDPSNDRQPTRDALDAKTQRGSIADPLIQGLTFGFGDEIAGGIGGLMSAAEGKGFGPGYEKVRDAKRADLASYRERHPVISTAAEIAGALPTAALPVGTVARGASLGAKMVRGAIAGAGQGALYGVGSAEGDVTDRALSGAGGMIAGGAIGGALPIVTGAASAVTSPIINAVRARVNPEGYAARKVAERIVNSGRSVESAARRIERAADAGVNTSLADTGGRGVQTLARTVANIPGQGADRIAARTNISAMSQGERLKRYVGEVFGAPGDGYQAAKATIMDARSQAARPYYERAYATPVPYTFELESLLNTPAGRAGLSAAKRNSANRREPWAQWFANVADDGSIIDARRVPDTRALDEVKRVLDNMVEGAKRPADGSPFAKALATPESIAIQSVRDDLLNFLRSNNRHYAEALKVGGDNIRANEALEFGRDALKADPRVIARRMGDPAAYGRDKVFDEGDRELARLGLAEALREKIDNAGLTHNALLKFFGNKEQMARLKPFFRNQDEYTKFRSQIIAEARKRKTIDFVRSNSTTARQLADLQEAGQIGEGVQIAADVARGGVTSAVVKTLQAGLRKFGGLTPKVADHIGRLLMTSDPQTVRGIIGQIQAIERQQIAATAKRQQIRALLSQFAAGQAGSAIGSLSSPQPALQ